MAKHDDSTSTTESAAEVGDDRQIVEKLSRQIRDSFEATRERRENFVENMKLLANDQWSEESKTARSVEGAERPMPVYNKAAKNVMTLAGVQAQTGTEPHLLPFEPDDVVPTEIMALLIRSIRERNSSRIADQGVFIHKMGNLGWWKIWIDYARKLTGEFKIEKLDPLSVFEDPNWLRGTWAEAQYCHQQIAYPLDVALETWSDHAVAIRSQVDRWQAGNLGISGEVAGDIFAGERLFWDAKTQRVFIFECWWKETVTAEVAVYLDTDEIEEKSEVIKELKRAAKRIGKKKADAQWLFLKRPVTAIKVAHLFGDLLLDEPDDSPYDEPEFPFFPALGYHFWKTPIGPVDLMKDPQRDLNRYLANIQEMMGRNTLSGWLLPKEANIDAQELVQFATGHGVSLTYSGGASGKPDRIDPPAVDQTAVLLLQEASRSIDNLPNVNSELQGQTTQTTVSGRAIEARQRGGLLTHEHLFFTFREEVARYTKFLIRLVQQYMTPAEALRILGSFALREPDNEHLGAMNELDDVGVLEALERSFSIEYDVVIGSKSYDPTRKQAEAQILTELRQADPSAVPIDVIFEVLGENGTLSKAMADKLVKRVQEAQQAAAAAAGVGGAPPTGGSSPAAALDQEITAGSAV